MNKSKAIVQLELLIEKYQFKVSKSHSLPEVGDGFGLELSMPKCSWHVLIIDDYNDWNEQRQLFGFYKVLDSLKDLVEYNSFKEWTQDYELDDSFEDYYQRSVAYSLEIKGIMGEYISIVDQINFLHPYRDKEDAYWLLNTTQ